MKEVLPVYQEHSGNLVPIQYQPFAVATTKDDKNNQKSNLNIGQRAPQENFHSPVIPSFAENYNFLPFAQLSGYSTTPQPSKFTSTNTIPKQFVIENQYLKSTAPKEFIAPNNNQNKQLKLPFSRNNPYFNSQQYINIDVAKQTMLTKKDSIISKPIYDSQMQPNSPDKYLNRNQPIPASQSSIFVSQETGSSPDHIKSTKKKQYRAPSFGVKPLSQEEFQALVDAGYPVTAVPIPIPYDEYIKQPQHLIETPSRRKYPTNTSNKTKLQNLLEPVHIQQQKQQEHNGGTVVSKNL